MLKPLEQWACDVCGQIINSPSEAYVIWKHDSELGAHSFKIIHHADCDLKDHEASMPIRDFIGTDGLTYLLSFWSIGPVMRLNGMSRSRGVADDNELVDLVRRLHTPHYEEARQHFSNPRALYHLGDANEYYPYMVETLQSIAQEYRDA